MSAFNGSTNEDLRKAILDQLRSGAEPVTPAPDPKVLSAAEREENARSEFFLRAHHDHIDSDTRAAALRQIQAALKTL